MARELVKGAAWGVIVIGMMLSVVSLLAPQPLPVDMALSSEPPKASVAVVLPGMQAPAAEGPGALPAVDAPTALAKVPVAPDAPARHDRVAAAIPEPSAAPPSLAAASVAPRPVAAPAMDADSGLRAVAGLAPAPRQATPGNAPGVLVADLSPVLPDPLPVPGAAVATSDLPAPKPAGTAPMAPMRIDSARMLPTPEVIAAPVSEANVPSAEPPAAAPEVANIPDIAPPAATSDDPGMPEQLASAEPSPGPRILSVPGLDGAPRDATPPAALAGNTTPPVAPATESTPPAAPAGDVAGSPAAPAGNVAEAPDAPVTLPPRIAAPASPSLPAAPALPRSAPPPAAPAVLPPPGGGVIDTAGDAGRRLPGKPVGRLPTIGAIPAPADAAPDAVPDAAPDAGPETPGRAIERYAHPFDPAGDAPRLAVILIDEGGTPLDAAALQALPFPIAFAIDATRPDAAAAMRRYRDAGQEVVAIVPLPQGARPEDVAVALEGSMAALPESVAVMEATPGGFGIGGQQLAQMIGEIGTAGRGLVAWNQGLNPAARAAAKAGLPAGSIYRDIDGDGQDRAAIGRFVDQAAFRAGQEGRVILLGHARAETLAALGDFTHSSRARSVEVAPLSAVLLGK